MGMGEVEKGRGEEERRGEEGCFWRRQDLCLSLGLSLARMYQR